MALSFFVVSQDLWDRVRSLEMQVFKAIASTPESRVANEAGSIE